jgi:signal transduction histidine kinase
MTGEFTIDWLSLTISLFNTILLLWLGLAILLNAERRRWGVWFVGGGLLTGGAFFLSHSAILGLGLDFFDQGVNLWWQVGWIPVVALPFAWYVIMLWYTGFWDDKETLLYRRHRRWFALAVILTLGTSAIFLFANPMPGSVYLPLLDLSTPLSIGGVPLLILIYPLHLVLSFGLSLDVLRRPGPSGRVMGELARQRANPWLLAATVVLLGVSLLVGGVLGMLLVEARQGTYANQMTPTLAWFDLSIVLLIALAVILTGQALVTYEIFTGKTLPRRGLRRYWHRAVGLAAGYSALVAWSLILPLRAIFSLLLATIMMTVFYALLSWRSFAERERYIENLRPFVVSHRLYDQLLRSSSTVPLNVDAVTPFGSLCRDILGAQVAHLIPLGPLAPFAGPPLAYPSDLMPDLPPLEEVTNKLDSPQVMWIPIAPERYGGASWAVPLWSERGIIGVLLLGMKRDGGLYTQEEIEIARTVGERLIDVRASAEMAGRLMALQRQRMAESQVLDQRARRVLHDDTLPQLHAAMLALRKLQPDSERAPEEVITLLGEVHRQIADLLREMPITSAPEVAKLGLFGALQRAVEDELGGAFNEVGWDIALRAQEEADSIPPLTAEVVYYAAREAVRNAARHGRRENKEDSLRLKFSAKWKDGLEVLIEDNGKGMTMVDEMEGERGQGLALHSTMMAVVGGSLSVESAPGIYTRVLLELPQDVW